MGKRFFISFGVIVTVATFYWSHGILKPASPGGYLAWIACSFVLALPILCAFARLAISCQRRFQEPVIRPKKKDRRIKPDELGFVQFRR